MTHWTMYWFTRLDSLQGLSIAMAVGAGMLLFVLAMISDIVGKPYLKDHWVKVVCAGLFAITVTVMVPTQKEAAVIWLIPKMVNNEQLNTITKNSLSILEEKTKVYLEDLTNHGE